MPGYARASKPLTRPKISAAPMAVREMISGAGMPGYQWDGPKAMKGTGARITAEERDLIIRTIIGEAEGEDDVGQQAVANVILNRFKSGKYGRDIKSIVLAPLQFSTWNDDALYGRRKRVESVGSDDPLYLKAGANLDKALAGDDPTLGATHFLNVEETKRIRKNHDLPDWAASAETAPLAVIGNHTFLAPDGLRPGQHGVVASSDAMTRARFGLDDPSQLGEGYQVAAAFNPAVMNDAGQSYLLHRTQSTADDLIAKARERQALRSKAQAAQDVIDKGEAAGQPPGADYYGYHGTGPLLSEEAGAPMVTEGEATPSWSDVMARITEMPMQAVGGVFDAARNVALAGDSLADWIETNVPLAMPLEEAAGSATEGGPLEALAAGIDWLNPAGDPRTETGKAVRGFTNFVSAFARAMGPGTRIAEKIGLEGKAGKAAASVGAGAVTGAVAMDPFADSIANLVQEFPGLQNPITEYLAVAPDDTEGEARLKKALEEAGFGALTEGLLIGLRAARDWYKASKPAKPTAAVAQAATYGALPEDAFKVLGDPEGAPLVVRAPTEAEVAARVLTKAERSTEFGVPDDVAANALLRGEEPAQEIFVNFARIDSPDDVKSVIGRMANTFSTQIDEARRGKYVSFDEMKKLADEQGMDVQTLLARRQGQPFSYEEALAARGLLAQSAEKLLETAKLAAAPNAGPVDQFNFRKMMALHYAIQAEVIGARTETARALASWRIPVGGDVEKARSIQQTMDALGGGGTSAELAKRLTMLAETGATPAVINTFARKGWAATTVDAIREFWINALLSSPTTHIVNTTSNTLVAFQQIMERKAAEGVGALRGSGDGVVPGEAAAMTFGMVGALKDAFRASWKALRTGQNIDVMGKIDTGPTPAITAEAFRIPRDNWLGNGMGYAVDYIGETVRMPGRALGAEDAFFKTIGYRMNLRAEALRMAYGEGKRGEDLAVRVGEILNDPPEHLKISAADAALYQTFTNETGKFGKGLLALRSGTPAVSFVLPFIKTPLNIARYAFERSPIAPAVRQWRADFMAGGARRDLALARMSTGSAIMLTTMDYADRGLITGAGPDDPGEREALMRQGWQPYSVKVGNEWYSYNRMDPLGMTLGFAADMSEALKRGEIEEAEVDTVNEVIASAIAAVSNTVVNKTYMEGVANFVDMMEDPDRYSAGYIDGFLGSFVPAGAAAAERIYDPATRERMQIGDAVTERIMGLSDSLPPKRDLWGKIIQPDSGLGSAFDALSPVRVSREKVSPVDAEMVRLHMDQKRINKTLNWDGVQVSLRDWPEVYDAYVRLAGNELKDEAWGLGAKDFLDAVVSGKHELSRVYELGSDGEDGGKATFIRDTISQYRQRAREAIMADPAFAEFADWIRQHQQAKEARELEAVQ